MDGVGGCGCRLVWGRRGKAQVRELGRGQGNFKLAANFGYNSRGSADPRESLRKRRILKLALTAHTVLPTPGARLLLRPSLITFHHNAQFYISSQISTPKPTIPKNFQKIPRNSPKCSC